MSNDECLHSRLDVSPTARGTNRLLWGDWNKGEVGILVRTLDLYDRPDKLQMRVKTDSRFVGGNATTLLPASFVHASMRAPNSMFNLPQKQVVAGVLVGTHYEKNTIYPVENGMVESPVCYPLDAGSNTRIGMLQEHHGRGCKLEGRAGQDGICMNGTCLFEPKSNCACQYKQVPPTQFGEFFSAWLRVVPRVKQGEPTARTDLYSCWFENSPENMRDMITASNSYWFARTRWSVHTKDDYRGWTECPVTSNVKTDINVVDAIVVQLPVGITSLCGFEKQDENSIISQLNLYHERGYENLPIVFLQQSNGMNQTDCNQVWNGTRCDQGYRKEIFSQTYDFDDGSCLATPPGCHDVYYFPANNTTGKCIVTSVGCKQFERTSVFHQKIASEFTPFEQQLMLEHGSPFPLSLPSSHLPILVNLLAMACLYFALRKGGGKKNTLAVIPKMLLMTLTLILFPMFLIHARIGHVISSANVDNVNESDIAVVPRQMVANGNTVVAISKSKGLSKILEPKVVPETASKSASAPSLGNVACPSILPDDTRIMLLTVVQAFHGSTALASVLMSSPMIATYCAGKTWQCEGFAQAKKLACPLKTRCLHDKRQLPKDRQPEKRQDFNLMDLMSFNWNLSRPVLHDKLFPREPGYTELWKHSLSRREVSPQMQKAGVHKIIPAYIIMWTPLCVLNVQKRSRTALLSPDAREFLQTEIWNLQQMKEQHEALRKSSTPVLVVSYADLLFREQHTLERMNQFLPCAGGSMNADFVPQMGVDIFPANKWKVRGTVHDFSAGLDPAKCCGYNVNERKCSNRAYFELIPEFENELNELDAYFRQHSS